MVTAITSNKTEDDSSYSIDLLGTASDADSSDSLSVANQSASAVDGNGSTISIPSGALSLSGQTLSVDPNAFNDLAVGESVVITYSYDVADGTTTTANTATITITGANDAPEITTAIDDFGFSEALDASAQDLSDSGTLSFTDIDTTDVIDVSSAVTSAAVWSGGTIDASLASSLEAGFSITGTDLAAPGSVNWTYSVNDADLDFLAAGEEVTATFTITVNDANGGTASQVVVVTITGTNDDPTITVVDVAGDITEGSVLSDSGSITFADLDLTDTPTASEATKSVTALRADGSTELTLTTAQQSAIEAGFSITEGASNANNGSVSWTYSVSETDLDFLAAGEEVTATFTITVNDANGGTASQDVVVTITGTNDDPIRDEVPPVFSSPSSAAVNENVAAGSVVYTAVAVDPATDGGPSTPLSYSLGGADATAFSINDALSGVVTINTSPDFEVKSSYSFLVRASDAAGNSSSQTVSLNIIDLDEVPPETPIIRQFSDNVGPLQGTNFVSGSATDDRTPTLEISAEPGSRVRVFRNGLFYGDAIETGNSGQFLFSTAELALGTYSFTVQASDAAGNVSQFSQPFSLTVELPRLQRYDFTYSYDNSDSYSGFVYRPEGTYQTGRLAGSILNETELAGFYTIDSLGESTTTQSLNNQVFITSYNDFDTGFGLATNIWPHSTIPAGYHGLGSEYGFAYDNNYFSANPYFSPYTEADILSQNVSFEFTYYYGDSPDSDYYRGYGYASRDYISGPGRYPSQNSATNDTGNLGFYEISDVQSTFDFGLRNINTNLWIYEYFDRSTDLDGVGIGGYGRADYVWSYDGTLGLGSERGVAYNSSYEPGDISFSSLNSADIASLSSISIRNVGNAWLQSRFEGNQDSSTPYTFEILRQGDISAPLTVDWSVQPFFGTDSNDFPGGSLPRGSVTLNSNIRSSSFTVNVRGDNAFEFSERFQVSISNPDPSQYTVSQSSALAQIVNDDGLFWAWTFGDPHLVTLDGLAYDFMAVGEFILLETTPGSDFPFQIQVRYEPLPGSEVVSGATRMAVMLGDQRVEMQLGPDPVLIDGQPVPIDPDLGGIDLNGDGLLDITQAGNEFTLRLNELGELIRVNLNEEFMDVNVLVAEPLDDIQREFRGLLGNRDRDTANDLQGRDGKLYTQPINFNDLYGPFADSWRVAQPAPNSDNGSLFSYSSGDSVGSFDNADFPQGVVDLSQLPKDLVEAAEAAADAAGITDPLLRQAAIYDFVLTGNPEFISASASSPALPNASTGLTEAPTAASVGVSASVASVVEGNNGTKEIVFRLWRTSSVGTLTIDYQVLGSIDANDFVPNTPLSGQIDFSDGEAERTLTLTLLSDLLVEPDEQLIIQIVTPNNETVAVSAGQATTTIISDDLPPVSINVIAGNDLVNAAEKLAGIQINGSATDMAEVRVSLAGLSKTVSVVAGSWSATFSSQELPVDGSYSVEAVGRALSGAETPASTRVLSFDTTPPNPPTIDPVAGDNVVNPSEAAAGLTLTGSAESSSQVRLSLGSVTRTVTAINGRWTVLIPANQLPSEGTASITITATDRAGNQSAASGAQVRFNRPPAFTSPDGSYSLPENSTAVSVLDTATDPDFPADSVTYSIDGDDASLFNFDSSTRFLSFKLPPDFEQPQSDQTSNLYTVRLVATDQGGLTAFQELTISVTDVVEIGTPPIISSDSTFIVNENTTLVGSISASDQEDDQASQSLQYSISGGLDSALFQVHQQTGTLSFLSPPNFEKPQDSAGVSRYNVQVQVRDSDGNVVSKDLVVQVRNVNEIPIFTGSDPFTFDIPENTRLVGLLPAQDPDAGDRLDYELSGPDATKFNVDSRSQFLSFNDPADFESPSSSEGTNTYQLTVTVRDSEGLFSSRNVVVNITGTNDDPTVSATAAAGFSEDASASAQALSDSGTVSFADIDTADTVSISFASNGDIAWSDGTLDATLAADLVAGFSTGVTNADAPGSTGWTYAVASSDLDFLAGGETITFSYTVTATDSEGATATDVVSFTITGTNDAPVITVGADDSDSATLTETENSLSSSGTLTVTDVDLSNTVGLTTAVAATGTTNGIGLTNDQLENLFTVTSGAINADDSESNNIQWSFDAGTDAFDYLADGESLTLTYTITAEDSFGATTTQDVTVTITGTNDAPVITSAIADFGFTEGADASAQDLSDSGTLSFSDIDTNDVIDVSSAVTSAAVWSGGTIDASLASSLEAGFSITGTDLAAPGSVNWTYSVNDANLDFLAAGETITLTYTVTITDNNNATDTDTVTVTITGTNDTPTILASSPSATLVESSSDTAGTSLSSITVTKSDIDGSVTFDTSYLVSNGWTLTSPNVYRKDGVYGSVSLSLTTGVVTYTLDNSRASTEALVSGDIKTEVFRIQVVDQDDATNFVDAVFTVKGTNDFVVVEPLKVSTPDLAPSSDTGLSDTDNITSDFTPLVVGTATPGAAVQLYDAKDNVLLGTSVVGSDGVWRIVSSQLSVGVYSLIARAEYLGQVEVSQPLEIVVTPNEVTAPVNFSSGNANGDVSVTIQSVEQVTSTAALNSLKQLGVQLNDLAIDFKVSVGQGQSQSNVNIPLYLVGDDLSLLADDGSRDVNQKLVYFGIDALGATTDLSWDPKAGAGARFYDVNGDGVADIISLKLIDGGFGDKDGQVNGVIDDPSIAGVVSLAPVLQAASNGFLTVSDPNKTDVPAALALKASLKSRASYVVEIGYVVLDSSELGNPGLIVDNLATLRERSQQLFSTLESTDVVLPSGLDFSSEFLLRNSQSIRFYSVVGATLDEISSLDDPRFSFLDLSSIGANGQANFSSESGITLDLSLLDEDQGLDALLAQEQFQFPVLDFSAFSAGEVLKTTLSLGREADYVPLIGLYRTVSPDGVVESSSGVLLRPGESGYAAAALAESNRVSELDQLTVEDGQIISKDVLLAESAYLAPYATADGQTYFSFASANADGYAHFRILGSNTFGFEDMWNGGDRDHDDVVFAFRFKLSPTT